MGNTVSLFRLALADFLDNLATFKALKKRSQASPGLPVDNPTRSFWMFPPSPIAQHCSKLPEYADFVVIGSGITGTSVAKALLDRCYYVEGHTPKLVMLEAREACSGATGRNGGHISPPLYHDYTTLREDHGDFRLAHLRELRRAAEEEGILEESQWREVETVDVFYNQEQFEKAKVKSAEAIQKYHLASDAVGCIASGAGAIHPYNFVTGILSKLLTRFFLCTNTPCTSISGPSSPEPLYTVVHAKRNSADQVGYDYLTQLPHGEREFILGGGFAQQANEGYEAMGNTDDSTYSKRVGVHLGGVLPRYFGEDNWGAEGKAVDGRWRGERRRVAQGTREGQYWSGILGISADLLPWPADLGSPSICSEYKDLVVAPPGEWIAAGYSGEGMVHAWMCGKALAEMEKLGEWFPDILRVTTGRWKKARAENLLDIFRD
ncbi:FAD dependent oxidoreductase [Melanogaster broomeanus]|nr:FAD dependent oxidoreductase [Melanogaster broomeanus]